MIRRIDDLTIINIVRIAPIAIHIYSASMESGTRFFNVLLHSWFTYFVSRVDYYILDNNYQWKYLLSTQHSNKSTIEFKVQCQNIGIIVLHFHIVCYPQNILFFYFHIICIFCNSCPSLSLCPRYRNKMYLFILFIYCLFDRLCYSQWTLNNVRYSVKNTIWFPMNFEQRPLFNQKYNMIPNELWTTSVIQSKIQ